MLKGSLGLKLDNDKTVTAISAGTYQEFCREYKLTLNAIPSGFYSYGIFNIIEIWLSKFRGILTRYLQ